MKSFIFITFAKFKLYDPNHTINMKINRHFVGFSLIVGLLLSSCQSKVDLIVHNANVYTLGQNNLKASAFVVDDGKFVDVGGEELLEQYTAKKVLDLQELPVYPGFIDSHCHFLSLGLSLNKVDLVGTKSFEDVLDRVKRYATNKELNAITGRGWDQNDWKIKRLPNKEQLDLLFPDIPVALRRIDGHAMLVNQKALDLAGITLDTGVTGGQIVKENGKLTGVLIDAPMQMVTNILPKPSVEDKIKSLQDAEEISFANGLTTVSVAGLDREDIFLIDSLHKTGALTIRVYAMISNSQDNVDYFLKEGPYKTDKLNVRSFKVYADGALGSRGAALKDSYSDLDNHTGAFITSKDSLEALAYKLAASPFQMNTHAIGDAANQVVLEAYNKALVFSDDPRWRVEHAQIIDTNDIKLFNRKILPSVQPTHATSDMYWAEDRLGEDRLYGAYANKALLEQSGRIALGTDFPVEDVNPFKTFYAAVVRKDSEAFPEEGYLPENKLSEIEALKGMTIWGAYANFEDKEKGSIEAGKVADFIILDRDIIKVSEKRILKTRVVATLVDGKIVYSNRIN
ncbi:MAG: N-substituted formamide deformylase [uncultured Bacteroidota bacterium]|nr:MAG: N-substituted formamide deformylase [uncultured Bacteroidetes bacterium]